MTREQAIAELKGYLKDYLEARGIDTRQNFRCLNPHHEDRHPSMGFDKANNQVHCFSCGTKYDVIDLISLDYNCDFNEALNRGCEMYHIPLDGSASAASSPIRKSAAELERERKEREAKREAEAQKTAEEQKKRSAELKAEFEAAKLATDTHPYLTEKRVRSDGTLRVNRYNTLLIDFQDVEGNFKTYQRIFAKIPKDGERKKFATGKGLVAGAFHIMGDRTLSNGDNILLCEGYATSASVYECIGGKYRVIMGVDSGNLFEVAKAIKLKIQNIKIIIAADFDDAGIKAAKACCEAGVADSYILPSLSEADKQAKRTDWNDVYITVGADATRAALLKALENPITPAKLNEQGDYDNPQPNNADVKADKQEPEHIIRVKCINANDLLKKELPPIKWAIEGILPMGLSLLAGSPKIGKSFLSLQLSLAVALGGVALGKIPVERGSALYLALEDPERRLQERMLDSGIDAETADLSKLDLVTELPRQNDGGAAFIKSWLDSHGDARLVVIDTLQKFRDRRTNRGDIYAADYAAMDGLKQLADAYTVPFLVIHHFRKIKRNEDSGDWVDNFLGTTGLAGAADTLLSLTRQRGQDVGILRLTGRDVIEAEIALKRDAFGWLLEGDAAEFNLSDNERQIVTFLKENGGKMPKEIADALGLKHDSLKTKLRRMLKDGKISQTGMLYFA